MSILISKIKFVILDNLFFTQYYEIKDDHLQILKDKLNLQCDEFGNLLSLDINSHICHNSLFYSLKWNKIDYLNIPQTPSCLFCKNRLTKFNIEFIYMDKFVSELLVESSFSLNLILEILTTQKDLLIHKEKIDKMIEDKRIKIEENLKIKQELRNQEILQKNLNNDNKLSYEVKCSDLRQNGYAIIQGHPCKIIAMSQSRD